MIFRTAALADVRIKDEADFKNKRSLLTDTFAAVVEPGLKLSLRDYLGVQAEVTTFLEQSAPDYWKDCDLLVTPILAVPPFSTKLSLGPDRIASEKIDRMFLPDGSVPQHGPHCPHQIVGRRHQGDIHPLRILAPGALEISPDGWRPAQSLPGRLGEELANDGRALTGDVPEPVPVAGSIAPKKPKN